MSQLTHPPDAVRPIKLLVNRFKLRQEKLRQEKLRQEKLRQEKDKDRKKVPGNEVKDENQITAPD
jgi:hypothetical protein